MTVDKSKTHLYPGQSLERDEQLVSSGFRLVLQYDGNLILYCGPYSITVWDTKTANTKASRLLCDGSGNLVDDAGKPYWSSNTAGKGIERFVLQDDGNFAGYKGEDMIWQTDTAKKCK